MRRHDVLLYGAGVTFYAALAVVYGEGLRRAYAALADADADETLVAWRGRLAVLPLLADLFSKGAGGVALGVSIALNVDWIVVSLPPAWSFRIAALDPPQV